MPTLFAELYDGEDEDEDLYGDDEAEITTELDEIDIDADEDDIICLLCGEVVEDGVQCPVCGWVREYTKPILGDL